MLNIALPSSFQLLRLLLLLGGLREARGAPSPVDVFTGGDYGVPQFRIPALIRTDAGTLVAFAEARTEPQTDCGHKWIIARRSVDAGVTWDPPVDVVGREWGQWATGNAQPVWHAPSRRIVLTVGSKDLGGAGAGSCQPGTAVFALDDGGSDGVAWGPPRNVSASLMGVPGGSTLVPGPGSSVTLASGRILSIGVTGGAYSFDGVYWSDDAGLSWTASPHTLGPGMDEASVTQLPDGRVYATLRNDRQAAQAYALSEDEGETWSSISFDASLPSPACEASIATLGGVLFFANPASTRERANITVRRQVTAAGVPPTAWEAGGLLVGPGLTWGGYSSIAHTPVSDGVGGMLFERNVTVDTDPSGLVISYVSFPLTW